jgi:pseudaminic acid synthase
MRDTHDYNPIQPVMIGNRIVGPGHPVYIVAELSANHRQDYDEAVRLIHAAKEAGADAVKLQTYTPDTMTIDHDGDRFTHKKGSLWESRTLYDLYKEAYMPWDWQPKLKAIAHQIGLDLFSSAYDPTSVDFLEEMDVPAIKISSFELVDLPLIRHAAATGKPLIISTGMASFDEIGLSVHAANSVGCREIILLKCTSAYPADPSEMNLRTITDLGRAFSTPCGLSDHSHGIVAPIAATALGACMIEKHFTLSRANNSVDAGFSLVPEEFRDMVSTVRFAERAMGSIFYGPTSVEKENLGFRRSLYSVEDIERGEIITKIKVRAIRPGGGLPPEELDILIGKRASKKFPKGSPITWDAIEEL